MANQQIRLKHSDAVADGTMAFHFHKPAGFTFKPGQAVDLVLTDPANPQDEGLRHAFSIVSAPFEDELVFATRMRDSAYKRILRALPAGATAAVDGPFGSLTLHKDRARPAVFIAGGIGITPFMSIVRQAARDRLPQQLLLLYSNRRPEDAAFLDELQTLEKQYDNFHLAATMTEMDKSNRQWQGETALLDATFIQRACLALTAPIYYLAGPPGMVTAMRQTLNGLGVDDDDIRSEDFYGY
ncbi:MAG: FAD-dependent oxidoreductase [Proteobacteria bacterium]|nr:FAD-dependent oxidoreductase [Pseudomonadota bacterium]